MNVVNFETQREVELFEDWETEDQLMFHTKEAVSVLLNCDEHMAELVLDTVLDEGLVPTDTALEYWHGRIQGG